MATDKKRLEALSELFNSEKAYLEDLYMWDEFRKTLLSLESLSVKRRYDLSQITFINTDIIIQIHENIVKDMKEKNKECYIKNHIEIKDEEYNINTRDFEGFRDLEYFSVYDKHLQDFNVYMDYAYRLPKGEFEIEREQEINPEFKKDVDKFFYENKISDLGIRHYIFRPTQKLPRYSMLFKAVLKNETNEFYAKKIDEVSNKIRIITKKVDITFGEMSNFFKLFKLSKELRYSQRIFNKMPLSLFSKRRKFIREGDVFVKNEFINEPRELRFILFDHVILLCDVVTQNFGEIKFIVSEPIMLVNYVVIDKSIGYVPRDEYINQLFPLFLLEKGGSKITCLFFKDINIRNLYFTDIRVAIDNARSLLSNTIKLMKLERISASNIIYSCTGNKSFDRRKSIDVFASSREGVPRPDVGGPRIQTEQRSENEDVKKHEEKEKLDHKKIQLNKDDSKKETGETIKDNIQKKVEKVVEEKVEEEVDKKVEKIEKDDKKSQDDTSDTKKHATLPKMKLLASQKLNLAKDDKTSKEMSEKLDKAHYTINNTGKKKNDDQKSEDKIKEIKKSDEDKKEKTRLSVAQFNLENPYKNDGNKKISLKKKSAEKKLKGGNPNDAAEPKTIKLYKNEKIKEKEQKKGSPKENKEKESPKKDTKDYPIKENKEKESTSKKKEPFMETDKTIKRNNSIVAFAKLQEEFSKTPQSDKPTIKLVDRGKTIEKNMKTPTNRSIVSQPAPAPYQPPSSKAPDIKRPVELATEEEIAMDKVTEPSLISEPASPRPNTNRPRGSFISKLFFSKRETINEQSFAKITGDFSQAFNNDESFILYTTDEGIFKKDKKETIRMTHKRCDKIVYDVKNNMIAYLEENILFVANFSPSSRRITPIYICDEISSFFYGYTLEKNIIAALKSSGDTTSSILLFALEEENNIISVKVHRRLYIGSLVFHICFLKSKMVVACKDFEIVDSDTLKTQELIYPLDPCIPYYFQHTENYTAHTFHQLSRNTFLACYDQLGFIIDEYGRSIKNHIVFSWIQRPKYIKIYKTFLIVLTTDDILIFSMKTADLLFYDKQKDMRFLDGADDILMHDNTHLYKIKTFE